MDLLSSLGLDGALPEQSTRLASHPGVARALEDRPGVCLGFDACLNCGTQLMGDTDGDGKKSPEKKAPKAPMTCKSCRRVKYCSAECRKADAEAVTSSSSSKEEEDAAGHSPVICALLALCDDDESAEAELHDELNGNNDTNNNKKRKRRDEASDRKAEAARYRVRTELESYPATLFNVPSEGPDWFVEALTRRVRAGEDVLSPEPKKRRRGKRERSSLSPTKEGFEEELESGRKRELVVHVIGASADAELWGWDGKKDKGSEEEEVPVLEAYAEASGNLHSYLQNLLESSAISIRCIFVGPDCPEASPCRVRVPIPDARAATLTMETHRCHYGGDDCPRLPSPDAVAFFNPGLSCPDYDWSTALSAAAACASPSMGPVPFLVTTNTEMEALADTKCLLESGCLDPKDLAGDMLEAVDWEADAGASTSEDGGAFFLGENPYAGLRVRQSGTMANDLYVKSRWIVGGLFRSSAKRKGTKKATAQKSGGEKRARKRRRSEGRGDAGGGRNAKRRNPALI